MRITSDTAQISGFSINGIKKAWNFLMHKVSSKTALRSKAFSWGCQIIPDNSYDSLRGTLEGIGFGNGDSLLFSITHKR
ncbi:MAG: hypothetical protein U9N32_04175 [Spirochaetota bacterium]|nr:hypothetical protein [Spirochaetota bacterium]